MSVYKHPTKAGWQIIKISHGRKLPAEYIPFHGSHDEAIRVFQEITGKHTDLLNPCFPDYLSEFMIFYRNKSAKRAAESMENSLRHLTAFLGNMRIRNITSSVIENYKATRIRDGGVKRRTVNVELSAYSSYVEWLNNTYRMNFEKPRLFSKRETLPPLPVPLDPATVVRFIQALEGDTRTIVEIMVTCGLRKAEVFGLTTRNYVPSGRQLLVFGKGSKERLVPVSSAELIEKLEAAHAQSKNHPEGLMFPSPRTGRKRTDLRKAFARAMKKADMDHHVYPHLLRHSFATILINHGIDIRTIQALLGHNELTTTMRYTQMLDSSLRTATDVLVNRLVANVANVDNK